jgi:hypothetical protein
MHSLTKSCTNSPLCSGRMQLSWVECQSRHVLRTLDGALPFINLGSARKSACYAASHVLQFSQICGRRSVSRDTKVCLKLNSYIVFFEHTAIDFAALEEFLSRKKIEASKEFHPTSTVPFEIRLGEGAFMPSWLRVPSQSPEPHPCPLSSE